MKTQDIRLFLGTSTSVDKRNLAENRASRELNARHEDGSLNPRYGYRNIRAAQGSFTAAYGFVYIQGYNSSNAEVEEYVSFEHLGANVAAYTRDVTTMAPTAITGATSLHASDWTGFSWNDRSFFINPNHTTDVYRHIIGDATSWVAMSHPADPTTALTWLAVKSGTTGPAYATLSWAGTDAGDVTVTGSCTTTNISVDSGGTLSLQHTASSTLLSSFEVDLNAITAGKQDWGYNDLFEFMIDAPLSGVFAINPDTIKISYTNDAGSPVVISPTSTTYRTAGDLDKSLHTVCLYFGGKTRADWTGSNRIKKIKVEYQVTASSGQATANILRIRPVYVGCCRIALPDETLTEYEFGYSYRVDASALESGIAGTVKIPVGQVLQGYGIGGSPMLLGTWIQFTHPATADADKVRYYWKDREGTWHLLTTQSDATTTFLLQMDYAEMLAAAEYSAGSFLIAPIVNAFPFKEWVVWLYQLGKANVRHTRINQPESQFAETDLEEDETRGANFTLADNFADTPLCGCQAGDSAIIGGYNGIYEQVGDRPSNMSPCKKMPGSFGVANKFAFCRFKDDQGAAGAAFVDRHGSGVYFAYPSNTTDRVIEGRVVELTAGVRGKLREFLLTEQVATLGLTDFSTLELFVDDAQDALWVRMGKRAMVLRRPNIVADEREWEFYDYSTGGATVTFYRCAASAKRRLRIMRSDGKTDELEWNSVDNVFISGVNRDGGNPMPPGFWRTKLFSGKPKRIIRIYLERDNYFEEGRVVVRSDRRKQPYLVDANRKYTICAPDQSGFAHEFEVELTEKSGKVTCLSWDWGEVGRRHYL